MVFLRLFAYFPINLKKRDLFIQNGEYVVSIVASNDQISKYFANFGLSFQSVIVPEKFQHILRVMGTNIDGRRKVMFALTAIKGVGRRFSNLVCKMADVDLNKRAGELSEEEVRVKLSSIPEYLYLCYTLPIG